MIERIFVVVLDSVGVGELPDAKDYGDEGSNTLGNLAEKVGGLKLPNFEALGLGNIIPVKGVKPNPNCLAAWGKMGEMAAGKDTTTGHWEMMGVIMERPFPVYPHGFPPEVIEAFEAQIGRKVLGNKAASGTEIIAELGEEHMRTGFPIVYTSADSVFQIAAHEEIIAVEQLYEMCRIARQILQGKHGVGRVIARPFVGTPGNFVRTERRHDFSLEPPYPTVLDRLVEAGIQVTGIGKIADIFAHRGITENISTKDNEEGIKAIIAQLQENKRGLVFANLVDFDMKYGHRNDVWGYAKALQEVDDGLAEIIPLLRERDVLILTADHGCDPTTASTDHSREYVPLLVVGEKIRKGAHVGVRKSMSDLGKTILELFGVDVSGFPGESFASLILK